MFSWIISFPKESDRAITKNYNGITLTAIAAKIYHVLIPIVSNLKLSKFLGKIKTVLEKSDSELLRFSLFVDLSYKKSWGNTHIYRYNPDIWFHSQTKDRENISNI